VPLVLARFILLRSLAMRQGVGAVRAKARQALDHRGRRCQAKKISCVFWDIGYSFKIKRGVVLWIWLKKKMEIVSEESKFAGRGLP